MDKKKVDKAISDYMAELGRKGAESRARSLSAERRKEIGKKGAKARWGKS